MKLVEETVVVAVELVEETVVVVVETNTLNDNQGALMTTVGEFEFDRSAKTQRITASKLRNARKYICKCLSGCRSSAFHPTVPSCTQQEQVSQCREHAVPLSASHCRAY